MLILTIVQNCVKLPHLEVTFLETSYLSVFGLFRPMIYRLDDLFQFFCRFCISSWSLTSGKSFIVIWSVVSEILRGVYHPQMPVRCQKEQMLLIVKYLISTFALSPFSFANYQFSMFTPDFCT